MSESAEKKYAAKVLRRLKKQFPEAECALNFETPLQLLVATILSAQCTDARVNMVTEQLFAKYPTAADVARLSQSRLEGLIQSTGFFRNKAENIRACCQRLVQEYDGEVPRQLEQLVALPGVGRKTANVVLGTAYGIASGVVVDTHVKRITNRLGMTEQSDPVKIEQDLMAVLPSKEWIGFSHRVIHFGRQTCGARRPQCEGCVMADICPRIGV